MRRLPLDLLAFWAGWLRCVALERACCRAAGGATTALKCSPFGPGRLPLAGHPAFCMDMDMGTWARTAAGVLLLGC